MSEHKELEGKKKLTAREQVMQTVKYTLIAASAGLIQFGTKELFLYVFQWSEQLSYLVSLILSVLWNFTFNRKYTFRSADNVPKAMLLVALYYAVFTPVSTWWTGALTGLGWNSELVQIGTMLVNFVTEFLFQRFVVFRGSIDTNDVAKRAMEKENRA